jgi:hypothetical protein
MTSPNSNTANPVMATHVCVIKIIKHVVLHNSRNKKLKPIVSLISTQTKQKPKTYTNFIAQIKIKSSQESFKQTISA